MRHARSTGGIFTLLLLGALACDDARRAVSPATSNQLCHDFHVFDMA